MGCRRPPRHTASTLRLRSGSPGASRRIPADARGRGDRRDGLLGTVLLRRPAGRLDQTARHERCPAPGQSGRQGLPAIPCGHGHRVPDSNRRAISRVLCRAVTPSAANHSGEISTAGCSANRRRGGVFFRRANVLQVGPDVVTAQRTVLGEQSGEGMRRFGRVGDDGSRRRPSPVRQSEHAQAQLRARRAMMDA